MLDGVLDGAAGIAEVFPFGAHQGNLFSNLSLPISRCLHGFVVDPTDDGYI